MLEFKTAYKQDGTLRKTPWSDRFVVQEPFVWEIDYEQKNKGKVVVPAWFWTNFGSIPAFFRLFFSPTKYISYVLHDYLYTQWSIIEYNDGTKRIATRKECDEILAESLCVEWMNKVWVLLVYSSVRIFWLSHFNKQ
jgi:hypothetical protein